MRVNYHRALIALSIVLCVSSSYAHNKVVVVTLGGNDAPPPIVYAIGDTGPAGGIVFDVTNGGLNGLEAAPVDQMFSQWNCSSTDVAGVDNIPDAATADSHSGADNTVLIALACGGAATVAAVYVWPNGQRDGFLPNKEELNLLFLQKDVVSGLKGTGAYWSSSEKDTNEAWNQVFADGLQQFLGKVSQIRMRTIRAF